MKIGVTGSAGFIGWHFCLRAELDADTHVNAIGRTPFSDDEALDRFVADCDCIVHLAGVNRASDDELRRENPDLARRLVEACERTTSRPHVVFASSTQIDAGNAYGDSKLAAAALLAEWSERSEAGFTNVVIPNVFGEFGRPFYNSVVATFCHQLATGERPQILQDRSLELVHVQRLCSQLLGICKSNTTGTQRIEGKAITVSSLLEQLTRIANIYDDLHQLPDMSSPLARDLFNTYRSFGVPGNLRRMLHVHSDPRGSLFEMVRAGSGGQCFASSTRPGVRRGEHFHLRKFESFFVIQGEAEIRLRKVTTDAVETVRVSGASPTRVDIPTFYTHDITNVGDSEMVTLFWTNEFFDPENPDTYPLQVEGGSR